LRVGLFTQALGTSGLCLRSESRPRWAGSAVSGKPLFNALDWTSYW